MRHGEGISGVDRCLDIVREEHGSCDRSRRKAKGHQTKQKGTHGELYELGLDVSLQDSKEQQEKQQAVRPGLRFAGQQTCQQVADDDG
jgi:hypothetical protein